MNAWLFQGQGSQRKGMGAALFARFPALVAEADAVLGYSIERLCLEDPEQQLNLTAFTQPAIYVVSWLGYLAAREDSAVASSAAGHSVGEYAALTAAGALDFALGLRIVIERARLMAQVEGGGLVAVLGHGRQRVQALLDELPEAGLAIANINSPKQIIVGGTLAALERLIEQCTAQGIRAIALKVSGPFHTAHMRAVEQPFRDFLHSVSAAFREPAFPVIANLNARPHTRAGMVEALSKHLTHPVQWQQVVERLLADGVEEFIEIGQPAILAGMLKDIREQPAVEPPRSRSRPVLVVAPDAPALLSELAHHGATGLFDSLGLSDEQLKARVLRLNAAPQLRGRYGIRLHGRPNPALLPWLAEQALACIEVPGHWRHDRCAGVRWLVRAECSAALTADADALVIAADTHLPLLLEALARRTATGPQIGASGLIGSPASAQAMFDMGVDFVVCGSVFLLSREAALPVERQQQLARVQQADHHPLTDWRYPEFASRTPGYVLDAASNAQAEALQTFYLGDSGGDWAALRDRLGDAAQPVGEANCARRALQAHMLAGLGQWQQPGDASLWLFNRWRQRCQPALTMPAPTAQLLDLLCPLPSPSRTTP